MLIFRTVVLLVSLALMGCDTGLGVSRSAPQQILLSDGTVVAGADGWCVDQSISRSTAEASVVVLGSCAALARDPGAPRPDVPGIVTVSVETQPGASPSLDELATFFDSDRGRAVLAQNGDGASVTLLETRIENEVLYLHSRDTSVQAGTDAQNWRAIFVLDGRFVSVSLFGQDDRPIAAEEGLAAIEAQAQQLRKANTG